MVFKKSKFPFDLVCCFCLLDEVWYEGTGHKVFWVMKLGEYLPTGQNATPDGKAAPVMMASIY